MDVYVEVGTKRVFAAAVEWPGWCRSGRDEQTALDALAAYAPRYASVVASTGLAFTPPGDASAFAVVERLEGDGSTDFGAPGAIPVLDECALDEGVLARLLALLQATWSTFDAVVDAHRGVELRKGPRGGGRDVDRIVEHVYEGDRAYLSSLGGRFPAGGDPAGLREAIRATLGARVRGEALPPRRSKKPPWPPQYYVRRAAWHTLDHAWEIEDRAG